MVLDKVVGADERIGTIEELENAFQQKLRTNVSEARDFADNQLRVGLLNVISARAIIYETILSAHWPTRRYKLRTITAFSGEPYHMEEYRHLLEQRKERKVFGGI